MCTFRWCRSCPLVSTPCPAVALGPAAQTRLTCSDQVAAQHIYLSLLYALDVSSPSGKSPVFWLTNFGRAFGSWSIRRICTRP